MDDAEVAALLRGVNMTDDTELPREKTMPTVDELIVENINMREALRKHLLFQQRTENTILDILRSLRRVGALTDDIAAKLDDILNELDDKTELIDDED